MPLFHLIRHAPEIRIDFNDGPCVEIMSDAEPHRVVMLDGQSIYHETKIAGKHWTRANKKYLANWTLQVFRGDATLVYQHKFNLKNQRVRINIDSKSLGDTLVWLPQIQRFAELHPHTTIHVSQFWKNLFDEPAYPRLKFIEPSSVVENCYATFNIGYYFENTDWHHPADPRTLTLGQVASDILGIPYSEKRPVLFNTQVDKQVDTQTSRNESHKPYVCIGTASTAECKHWLYPGGWQTIVDYLEQKGFETMIIQKEKNTLERVNDQTGDRPINERIQQLANCEFFIGLSSGLSWLAWAVGKPVVLISGFSEPYTEFENNCVRVANTNVCTGCWNDTTHTFERGDWHWCPRHKGTNRAFECSKSITPRMVVDGIEKLRVNNRV